jgi:hypothetical protein
MLSRPEVRDRVTPAPLRRAIKRKSRIPRAPVQKTRRHLHLPTNRPRLLTPVTLSAVTATNGQRTPAEKNAVVVWVNSDSGVYHKPGTRWYGKTKHGKYMTKADAIKAGYKPSAKK